LAGVFQGRKDEVDVLLIANHIHTFQKVPKLKLGQELGIPRKVITADTTISTPQMMWYTQKITATFRERT
jgi:hypothetical protein